MTEFFQPTTHVRADCEWVSYVHRTYRTLSYRRSTFKAEPFCRQHDKQEGFSEIFIARFMNMCERTFSEGQACFKTMRRPVTEEQIAKVRILIRSRSIKTATLIKNAR